MRVSSTLVAVLAVCVRIASASNVTGEDNTSATTTTSTTTTTIYKPFTSSTTTTKTLSMASGTGSCVGNDSRCSGSSQQKCATLSNQGTDCDWVWEAPDTSEGDCSGNDSRCQGSNQAACARLAARGTDCSWIHSAGPEGTCLGNDSRCAGTGKQICEAFASEGADCKWRAAFNIVGNLLLHVSDAASFVSSPGVQDAAVLTVANITGLPDGRISANLDGDLGEQTRRLLSTGGKVMLTYACSVPGDAQPTPTGEEVSAALMSTNLEVLTLLFRDSLDQVVGEGAFTVTVLSTFDLILNISGTTSDTSQSSGMTSTTSQSSGTTSITSQSSGTTSTSASSMQSLEDDASDAEVVTAYSLAHGLVFLWSFYSLL